MLRKAPEHERPSRQPSRGHQVTLMFAVIILVPSMIGFGMKFYEFIHTFQDEAAGAFAITPMVNYLLASMGFLFLLLWAATNGMFRDMEEPKRVMLQNEMMLDDELENAMN